GFDAPNGLGAAHLAIIRADSGYVNWSAESVWTSAGVQESLLYAKRTDLRAELLRSLAGLMRGNPKKNAKESSADEKDDYGELFECRRGLSGRLSSALGFRGIYQSQSYCRTFGNINTLHVVLGLDRHLPLHR